VKPENVVISPHGAVLLDFGIARAVWASGSDRLTRSGIAVGTSTYMSPEQITALQEIDLRSDLYSLACVLFECLAGQPPFVHRNEAVVLQMHLNQPAPDVRTIRPEIPAELAAGVGRALAKTPEERWQTAAAMRDALAAVMVG
jgi:eukaryotic-like serine/threonine-protein kinase